MALTETLHIDTVSAGRRHVEAVMPITSDVLQPHGYLHGGATIALLETVASIGAEQGTDFERERPFGVDVRVRHRKGGRKGMLRGVADLDREFQRKQREFREDLNQRRNEELAQVLERANRVIRSIAEQRKYDLIVQEAVYVNPRIDITDEVLKALNLDAEGSAT